MHQALKSFLARKKRSTRKNARGLKFAREKMVPQSVTSRNSSRRYFEIRGHKYTLLQQTQFPRTACFRSLISNLASKFDPEMSENQATSFHISKWNPNDWSCHNTSGVLFKCLKQTMLLTTMQMSKMYWKHTRSLVLSPKEDWRQAIELTTGLASVKA